MLQLSVSRWLFPLPAIVFIVGLLLTWIQFEEFGAGLMAASLLQFVVQIFALQCGSCGKSPYIREAQGRVRFSAPTPERVCSRCGHVMQIMV